MCVIILLTGGFEVFTKGNWDPANFVSSYLYVPGTRISVMIWTSANRNSDIPLVTAAFLFWKFFKKTKFVSLDDVPLRTALEQADQKLDEEN